MKKSKKIFILSMIICLNLIFTITVNASTKTENNYSPLNSNEEFTVKAYIIDENGTRVELDTIVEVVALNPSENGINLRSSNIPVTYTIKIKTVTKPYAEHGIIADGSLSMTWNDVPGKENKITNLSGYWAVAEGTFDHGDIYWGSVYAAPIFAPHNMQVGQNFDEDIDYTSTDTELTGFGKLTAHSVAVIKSPTDSKIYTYAIEVSPSIID